MSDNPPTDPSMLLAEEILRTIYGDDLNGCSVTLDSIAAIIRRGMTPAMATADLLALHEKVVEAVQLLSEPPPAQNISDPKELQLLLSKRLDSIHALTTRTRTTVELFKEHSDGEQSS